ncbi:class I SAM-dependent methyltransferase [Lacicoccus qingdaonensis]|uniref:Ubiquinone/menaquinone biosynthesis C-methylase UbiE n=1 Tax=Lacicoccus qingdaonensis TaxID=576118 RepID=A0A1G9B461_9BACL|nr:class I SAM-dependent methyltransferase [Salinicoccus qingdaonensis]SDK34312.1 Ubiquinone/menaquinone biosynthesis C-methylase UbiE [Salinicoccus qingdaonensis]
MKTEDHIKKFDRQVDVYVRMRDNDKFSKYRSRLFHKASGDVLEVGVGTGLNFPYFNEVEKLTAVDFSEPMIAEAEKEAVKYPFPADFIRVDAEDAEFEDDSFDTIVSSLSFCSYNHPVELLNKFNLWCKEGGRILLFEHGLVKNKVLQTVQKAVDPLTMSAIGCHQNRDIEALAESSDLKIVEVKRYVLGALYLIEAKPLK